MINKCPIQVKLLNHRGKVNIGLFFEYNTTYIELIKSVNGRKYSKTYKCWYLPNTIRHWNAFKSLGIQYIKEENNIDKKVTHGTTKGSQTEQLSPVIEKKESSRKSSAVVKCEETTTDIIQSKTGKATILYSNKHFFIKIAYGTKIVTELKKIKNTWWNKEIKKWICYGSFENLYALQSLFECWSEKQIEQLVELIQTYDGSRKMTLFRLPHTTDRVAIILIGLKIDLSAIKKVQNRQYEKKYSRWIIDNHKETIESLIRYYRDQGVTIINKLSEFQSRNRVKSLSNGERQKLFIAKFPVRHRYFVKSMTDRMIQLRYSWQTARTYSSTLVKFNNWLKKDIAQCTQQEINEFLEHFSKQKVSESWINMQVSGLKFYFSKVVNRPDIILEQIKRPKKSYSLPRILSKQEVLRMIEVTTNLKHRTILYTIYSSGLRLSELLNLKLENINWDRNQIFIRFAKGKKDRVVMLSEVLKGSLMQYCNDYKPMEYLFEGISLGTKYSTTSVQKIVRNAARKAKISQKVSPHVLRHCFATHLHDGGTSIALIQQLLGHKNIRTTLIYTHISTQSSTSVVSPLDELGKKA